MRIRVFLVLLIALLVPALTARADTTYTSQSAFEAAAGSVQVETFNSATLNPGLTITGTEVKWPYAGDYAFVGDEVEWGRVVPATYGEETITYTFATAITAFGGLWDLYGPGGPGTGICVSGSSSSCDGIITDNYSGQFWGIIFSTPVTTVILSADGESGIAETHELENLEYSSVPEPGTIILLGTGLLGLARMKKRVRRP